MQSPEQNHAVTEPAGPKSEANTGQNGSASRRERRRAETRERLFHAAMTLLSELPFDAVTVERIARAAEVGKGTFFNYFASKEAVVAYRYESQRQHLTIMLGSVSTGNVSVPPPLAADVPAARGTVAAPPVPISSVSTAVIWPQMMSITHLLAERDAHSKRLARNLLALPLVNEEVREASQTARGQVRTVLESLIAQGQTSGEIRDGEEAGALADYLIGVYFTTLTRWAQSDSTQTLHEAIDQTYRLVWQGLRSEQANDTDSSPVKA